MYKFKAITTHENNNFGNEKNNKTEQRKNNFTKNPIYNLKGISHSLSSLSHSNIKYSENDRLNNNNNIENYFDYNNSFSIYYQ